MHTLILGLAALLCGMLPVVAQQRERIDAPIKIGGDSKFDACESTGQVVGLNPRGDGFLSVQCGPGGRPFREIDRLFNSNQVYICGEVGPWLAVVYPAGRDCGVSTPWVIRQPYTGPCRYGWVHSRYIRGVAS